jgi:hypothetical protein
MKFRLGLVALLALGNQVSADIYVDNRLGRDSNTGRSPVPYGVDEGPLHSVTLALRMAAPGERVVMLPTGVPYSESIRVDGRFTNGAEGAPIVLEGNGNEVSGFMPIPDDGWEWVGDSLWKSRARYRRGANLTVDGEKLPLEVRDLPPSPSSVKEGTAVSHRGHYLLSMPGRMPGRAKIAVEQLPAGVFIHRANHIIIRNLLVRGFAVDGVQVRGPAKGIQVENCRITENNRAGISGRNNAVVRLDRASITGNGVGVERNGFSKLLLLDVALADNRKPELNDGTGTFHKSGEDPGDITLKATVLPDAWVARVRAQGFTGAKPVERPAAKETADPEAAPKTPAAKPETSKAKKGFFDE